MQLEIMRTMNGVDTARLRETISALKASPELGRFKFRLENRWVDASENQSHVRRFYGCGEAQTHNTGFTLRSDEPELLLGADTGANPVEHLLHALASCITRSMIYHAAARGIQVEKVESMA